MKTKIDSSTVPIDTALIEHNQATRFHSWGTARLRLLFLGPLASITIIIILSLSVLHYQQEEGALQQGVVHIHTTAQKFYEETIQYDAQVLQAIMHSLGHDAILHTALAQRDRAVLLQHAQPHFEELRHDFNITHFYFTLPDRVNLLRVHTPSRYGDVINRITTLQAESSGKIAYGIELGPLGTFTLRLVSPWYDEQSHKLIGYVELGMEIDQALKRLEEFYGLRVITTIYKKFLQRDTWLAGMHTLGRAPHWDRFTNVVAWESSTNKISPLIIEILKRNEITTSNRAIEVEDGGFVYQVVRWPINDAGGRQVAQILMLADVTSAVKKMWLTIYIGGLAMLVAGIILFVIFYWLTGKIGQRIEYDEQELQNLAIRDGLTKLYNHRSFYALLDDEIKRALRHTRPLALLMLDIDYFKRVNDTYGHRAGDLVLCGLSDLLMGQARETDRVCRYGGEEMTLILPEITKEEAIKVAERIRKAVEAHSFVIDDGQQLSITVSVGLVGYPDDADTKETLVKLADDAMYQAKQTGRNRVCVYGQSTKG